MIVIYVILFKVTRDFGRCGEDEEGTETYLEVHKPVWGRVRKVKKRDISYIGLLLNHG